MGYPGHWMEVFALGMACSNNVNSHSLIQWCFLGKRSRREKVQWGLGRGICILDAWILVSAANGRRLSWHGIGGHPWIVTLKTKWCSVIWTSPYASILGAIHNPCPWMTSNLRLQYSWTLILSSIALQLFLGVDGMSATVCKVTPDPIHQWSKWVTLLASARRRIHWWQMAIHLQSTTTRAWFHVYEAAMQELAHVLWVLVMGLLMDHLVLMQFFW